MKDLTPELSEIKAHFIAERGYWRSWAETMLHLDPQFLVSYADYAGHPALHGPLSERMVELIYVALDASSTHLYEPGLKTHLRKAGEAGATAEDVMDVLHLVSCQGIGAVQLGAEILLEQTGQAPERSGAEADPLQALAVFDPDFCQLVQAFLDHRGAQGGLDEGERCLVQIALHGCFTGFAPKLLRQSIQAGLTEGLAPAAIFQALQLGAHLSLHGTSLGISLLESSGILGAPKG